MLQIRRRALQLPTGELDYLSMFDFERNSHVYIERVVPRLSAQQQLYVHSILAIDDEPNQQMHDNVVNAAPTCQAVRSWKSVRQLVNCVH